MGDIVSHYDVLEVSHTASAGVIRAAYKSLCQIHHPDRNPNQAAASEARLKAINAAYAVLGDPSRRAAYDAGLSPSADPAPAAPVEPQTPPSGWGLSFERSWSRWLRGWSEYNLANDTAHHAWVVLFSEAGRALRAVFVRSGERAGVVVAARPVSMTVALGHHWNSSVQGFSDVVALWRCIRPFVPPGSSMRLDLALNRLDRTGRFESLPVGSPSGTVHAAAPNPTHRTWPSRIWPALGVVCLLLFMVVGAVSAQPWVASAAGAAALAAGWLAGSRWWKSGERLLAASGLTVVLAVVWGVGSWIAFGNRLAAAGWVWVPSAATMLLWSAAALGPPAWALAAATSVDTRRLRWPGVVLMAFVVGLAFALWGAVFGWDDSRWSQSPPRWAVVATVASLGVMWTLVARVGAEVVCGLSCERWPWFAQRSSKLLASWMLLPFAAWIIPWLPHGAPGWLLLAWSRLAG